MLRRTRWRRSAPGFTLVEVLVALLVAAVVGGLSYRGLDSLLRADSHLQETSARWLAVHRFLAGFEVDIRAALSRGGRDAGGTAQPAFIGQAAAGQPFGAQLALLRPNDPSINGALPVQRVAYRLRDGNIELMLWPAADLSPYGEPKVIVLLAGVETFALRYVGPDGVWRGTWPFSPPINVLPRGVELTLRMRDPAFGGAILRVFTR